jgi:hypothetical protein
VANDRSGYSVSSAGDVNGDGLDDLIVGATYADPSGKSNAGKSYVVFGKADGSARVATTIIRHLAINHKASYRVVCISTTQSPAQAMSMAMAWMI